MPQHGDDKVRILIFSKHLRLMKERKSGILQLDLPGNGEFISGRRRIPCKTISIIFKNNSFILTSIEKNFNKGVYSIYPLQIGDTFSVELNGEKRIYPLPLHIKNSGTDIELSVEERVDQFSIDSAWSELGETQEKNSEALYALTHLIKARCSLPYLTGKHKGYHFCDLSCCQTYKGRSGLSFTDTISIKTDVLKNGLFFNTSNGGKLFTESIFNSSEKRIKAPEEIIYSENLSLSSKKYNSWEAVIGDDEITAILYPGKKVFLKKITFDREKEIMFIESDTGTEIISPETFRIKINRVKGWNFIKSNNYIITKNNSSCRFRGSGLGHGAGISFEGALQLSEKGYSRYEILEHYYPEIEYNRSSVPGSNHQLQYVLFNCESGEIINISGSSAFLNRTIPCGSLFKLFIALYMAEKKPDLFHNYSYICTDKEKDKFMPDYCWKKSGHGKVNISSALYHSCNKYFASLYSRINPADFKNWVGTFAAQNGIELTVPVIKNQNDFALLLAGLNFNLTISISGIIKLNRYIYLESKKGSSENISLIFNALHKTFTEGTAGENRTGNIAPAILNSDSIHKKDLWGKTGTVISGTNSHHGYGLFTGGLNSTGIAAILRKGTGAMAAGESKKILLKFKESYR